MSQNDVYSFKKETIKNYTSQINPHSIRLHEIRQTQNGKYNKQYYMQKQNNSTQALRKRKNLFFLKYTEFWQRKLKNLEDIYYTIICNIYQYFLYLNVFLIFYFILIFYYNLKQNFKSVNLLYSLAINAFKNKS